MELYQRLVEASRNRLSELELEQEIAAFEKEARAREEEIEELVGSSSF